MVPIVEPGKDCKLPEAVRRQGVPRRALFGASAVLASILAGAAIVPGGQDPATFPAARAQAPAQAASATPSAGKKPSSTLCAPRLPWDTIQQQTALGLHSTVAQVRAQILQGKPIQVIAAAHHVSLSRLHSIELHALEVGNKRWIRLGCNTRQEGNAYMRIYRRMTPAQLNEEFTHIFLQS